MPKATSERVRHDALRIPEMRLNFRLAIALGVVLSHAACTAEVDDGELPIVEVGELDPVEVVESGEATEDVGSDTQTVVTPDVDVN